MSDRRSLHVSDATTKAIAEREKQKAKEAAKAEKTAEKTEKK